MDSNLTLTASIAEFDGLTPPWAPLPSIHDFLRGMIDPQTHALPHSSVALPVAEMLPESRRWRFAPYVEDGYDDRAVPSETEKHLGPRLGAAVLQLARDPGDGALARVFDLAAAGPLLGVIDEVLEFLLAYLGDTPRSRVRKLGRYLALRGGHHAVVKLGIALIGVSAEVHADVKLLCTLGLHDEFTIYSVAALSCLQEPEPHLFFLAQRVQGWSRIQLVERLAETRSPTVRRWLLCDGYRNPVMTEYLAFVCARAGKLADALGAAKVEPALLDAAAGMLHAMCHEEVHGITGVESIMDYADAPLAAERYLSHVVRCGTTQLEHFIAADSIWRFLDASEAAEHVAQAWGGAAERCRGLAREIVAREDWPALARAAQTSPDRASAWSGDEVAARLGLDAWPILAARVSADPLGDGPWSRLIDETVPTHVDQLVRLTFDALPLAEIATGPANELGLGPAYRAHSRLAIVLHGLKRFPGQGWDLLAVGLLSPVVNNRTACARALAGWPRDTWPPEVVERVSRAHEVEPNEGLRGWFRQLLDGRPPAPQDAG